MINQEMTRLGFGNRLNTFGVRPEEPMLSATGQVVNETREEKRMERLSTTTTIVTKRKREDPPVAKAVEVDVDDYECAICQGLLVEPVQLSCQHMFCKPCINRSDIQHCPVCRARRQEFTCAVHRQTEKTMKFILGDAGYETELKNRKEQQRTNTFETEIRDECNRKWLAELRKFVLHIERHLPTDTPDNSYWEPPRPFGMGPAPGGVPQAAPGGIANIPRPMVSNATDPYPAVPQQRPMHPDELEQLLRQR